MAIWESNTAFLENVQIDLEMVARCTIQLATTPRNPVSKRCPLFGKLLFRIFSVLTVLTARLCLSFNPHITLWSWLWGEKLSTFLKKPASPKLFDGFIICRETHHRAAKKKKSGRTLSFMWRSIILGASPAPADVSYVPKERISHDIHHSKKKLITSKKNDLPTGNMFESENSLRFTFNVSLGGKTALKKVNGLFWTENWKNIQKTQL